MCDRSLLYLSFLWSNFNFSLILSSSSYFICGRYIQMKLKAASNLQAELCVSQIALKSMRFFLSRFPHLKSSFILILYFLFLYHMAFCCTFLFAVCPIICGHSLSSIFFNKCIFIALFITQGSIFDEKMSLLSKLLSYYAFCPMMYDLVQLCTEVYIFLCLRARLWQMLLY
jgi:hypothetical protein